MQPQTDHKSQISSWPRCLKGRTAWLIWSCTNIPCSDRSLTRGPSCAVSLSGFGSRSSRKVTDRTHRAQTW